MLCQAALQPCRSAPVERRVRSTVLDASADPAAQDPETRVPDTARRDDASDRELLERIRHEDRDAFRQLYLDYHARLARFLTRVTRHPDDIAEIVNDALLIVWQRAGEFRGASRVSTWIFSIAYRCALKSIRRTRSRTHAVASDVEGVEAAVEDTSQHAEDRQLLDIGLAQLPLEQRYVLVLAYYLDYSCEEIAEIVECPVNTVKTRMFHARRKLRAILSAASLPLREARGPDTARGSPLRRSSGLAELADADISDRLEPALHGVAPTSTGCFSGVPDPPNDLQSCLP
jgi:RNA polymerase sigma-70 factor (ECF subfamily)